MFESCRLLSPLVVPVQPLQVANWYSARLVVGTPSDWLPPCATMHAAPKQFGTVPTPAGCTCAITLWPKLALHANSVVTAGVLAVELLLATQPVQLVKTKPLAAAACRSTCVPCVASTLQLALPLQGWGRVPPLAGTALTRTG